MPNYTDKGYYIDGFLATHLDFCLERQAKKWDNLLIIDGDEGSGKTTMSWGVGYYWAYKLGKPFTVENNIFFDIDKLMAKAVSTKGEVLVWDESALEGLSSDHQNQVQRKLVKVLMTARSRGHFWIFIVPKIFRLNKYIIEDRCTFFINVYSPDNLTRGLFRCYSKASKDAFLDKYRFTHKKQYEFFKTFRGKFTKAYADIIDNDAYEEKKDKAVREIMKDKESKLTTKLDRELNDLRLRIYKACKYLDITQKRMAFALGVNERTIRKWSKSEKAEADPLLIVQSE